MKRLAGTTLADVLRSSRRRPRCATRGRSAGCSRAFADVCLAIEFAHTRGVVHRDLKPANIMLGDFGEVYVLDWGIARVLGDDDATRSPTSTPALERRRRHAAGALLGTPGYMAPEQIARRADVDARADVYALGCILFEILAGAAAAPARAAALDVALDGADARPRDARPDRDVPPELDALCARATAADRGSAPDRARARRRDPALPRRRPRPRAAQASSPRAARADARVALARRAIGDDARATRDARGGPRARARSVERGRAGRVRPIWLAAPRVVPEAAMAASDRQRAVARVAAMRWVWRGYLVLFVLLVAVFEWGVPVRHAGPVIAVLVFQAATTFAVWLVTRRLVPMRSPLLLVAMLLNAATIAAGSLAVGPLLVMPSFAATSLAVVLAQPTRFRPSLSTVAYGLAVFGPLALEWLGLLPSTYYVKNGALVLAPWAVTLTPAMTVVIVVGALVRAARDGQRARRSRSAARRMISRTGCTRRAGTSSSCCRRAWPGSTRAPALEVSLAACHQPAEALEVVRAHDRAQPLDRVEQRRERLGAVVVERLDLEVEVRVLRRDLRGDAELRVERRRRQRREPRRGLAALGERGEERDVERVRQPEHVGDQPVVALEIHLDERRHRRLEQRARRRGRLAARRGRRRSRGGPTEQLGVGAEHRVHRA